MRNARRVYHGQSANRTGNSFALVLDKPLLERLHERRCARGYTCSWPGPRAQVEESDERNRPQIQWRLQATSRLVIPVFLKLDEILAIRASPRDLAQLRFAMRSDKRAALACSLAFLHLV